MINNPNEADVDAFNLLVLLCFEDIDIDIQSNVKSTPRDRDEDTSEKMSS